MLFEKRVQLDREYHDWIRSSRIGDNFLNAIAFLESRGMIPVERTDGDVRCTSMSPASSVITAPAAYWKGIKSGQVFVAGSVLTGSNPNAETINLTPEQAAAFQECDEPITQVDEEFKAITTRILGGDAECDEPILVKGK